MTRWPAWRCRPARWPWPRPSAIYRASSIASTRCSSKHGLRDIPLTRAHHRLPEWLRASVSRRDRAHRPRARPLHAAARRRCRGLAAERACIATTSTRRPSSPRSMSSSAATPPSGMRTSASATSCGARTCSQRRCARDRAVARELPKAERTPVSLAGAPTLDAVAAAVRSGRGRRRRASTTGSASVDAATRVRWALKNLPGSVRAVVELRRAGRGVAASDRPRQIPTSPCS